MAPCRVQIVLALELEAPWRPTNCTTGDTQAYPRDEHCQSADGIAAMDMFVVPTISFRLLYGLLIMGHGRRHILWFGVTSHPSAEWIANQITEACGWEQT